VGADGADGALGILEGSGMPVARAETVFKDERGDAVLGEPLGDLLAFVAGRQAAVAAAGTDDDGGAGRLACGGKIGGQGGFVLRRRAQGTGSAFGPEESLLRLGGLGGIQERQGKEERSHEGCLEGCVRLSVEGKEGDEEEV